MPWQHGTFRFQTFIICEMYDLQHPSISWASFAVISCNRRAYLVSLRQKQRVGSQFSAFVGEQQAGRKDSTLFSRRCATRSRSPNEMRLSLSRRTACLLRMPAETAARASGERLPYLRSTFLLASSADTSRVRFTVTPLSVTIDTVDPEGPMSLVATSLASMPCTSRPSILATMSPTCSSDCPALLSSLIPVTTNLPFSLGQIIMPIVLSPSKSGGSGFGGGGIGGGGGKWYQGIGGGAM